MVGAVKWGSFRIHEYMSELIGKIGRVIVTVYHTTQKIPPMIPGGTFCVSNRLI
jgi:hypothetical protein